MSADARIVDPTRPARVEIHCWRCSRPISGPAVPEHADCLEPDGSLLVQTEHENLEEQ